MHSRFIKIRNVLLIVLVLNWVVSLAKLICGFISRCTAMSADGFHSFADGTSNIIGLVGIWVASQPVDKEHPYGHKKYETFAAIIISILLFIISFNLIHDGIERLYRPVLPDVTATSFLVMLFTVCVNGIVVIYERRKSSQLNSDILAADSKHTVSDIMVSISVIFTLLAIKAGFPMMDTVVSVVIAVFIGYSAFNILRDSSAILCDREAVVSDDIRNAVLDVEGVKDCHKIRTRGRLDDVHVDLHIVVKKDMHVSKAHELNHAIEEAIKNKISGVTDIVIHIEPNIEDEKNLAD